MGQIIRMPPTSICPGCDSVRVSTDHPHIHSHLLIPCAELQERGHGAEELCCHGCHAAETVIIPLTERGDRLKTYLARYSQRVMRFYRKHSKCKPPLRWSRSTCPNERSSIRIYDMRKMSTTPQRRWKRL